jgi:hypothetical protein
MVAIQQAYKRSPLAAMMWSPLSAFRVIRDARCKIIPPSYANPSDVFR